MKIYNTIKVAVPVVMLALTATSCKEESSAADKIPDNAVTASANTPEENEQAQQAAANQAVVSTSPNAQIVEQFTAQQQPAATTTAPGMNPPHGQPGHICEIPVGAPLSSAPAKPKAAPQPATAQIQPAEFGPAVAKEAGSEVVTAPGMNPPHGQPGHLCSIAVGAPLPK